MNISHVTYIVKNEWGKIVRLHKVIGGAFFIENFTHWGDVYDGLKEISATEANKLLGLSQLDDSDTQTATELLADKLAVKPNGNTNNAK